ncbi:hypothetical protein K7432_012184 [Basidiobolus ranarum]|uniref:Uncharacterized protein n=1 Tax=Basidiobolus ranarum TaxID=34480 RepID=A0ABR2VSR9_9FUNG
MTSRNSYYIICLVVLLVLALSSTQIVEAANPISFCKCVCGTNVTIVELKETPNKPCQECTKAFCLTRDANFCSGAGDSGLLATCFQRDSYKDQVVIYIFLIVTGGLLVAALLKPYRARWQRSTNTYSTMAN